MDTDSKPSTQDAVDSIVLEEEIDPNYVPSEPEVVEYAKWMGMDLDKDQDLFWIAREGLMAPLPKDWKPCKTKDTEDIYYFNFTTGDSTWDHPCDGYYKRLYEEEKKKKETVIKESGDQNRSKAKQDVEQLLGKAEKKKNKKVSRALGEVDLVKALPAPLGLQKAPLPGINNPLRMSAPSSLGPLGGSGSSGSGIGAVDPFGSLSKGTGMLKKGDLDVKVSSSLEGGRLGSLASSRDPSPLNRIALTAAPLADQKTKQSTTGQSAEQKDNKEDDVTVRGRESDVERRMGRLDVTASLSAKSRSLGAASKLRSSLPSANSPVDRDNDWRSSPSEDKHEETGSRYNDYKAHDDKSEGSAPTLATDDLRKEARVNAADNLTSTSSFDASPAIGVLSAPSSSTGSERDVSYYRNKCADVERRLEECELRVADYKTSYSNAKEDLLALERRYESSQSQWIDRLRAVEVEKDKVESERRQLKLALIDLESAASAKPVTSTECIPLLQGIDEATKLENDRLSREVDRLKLQIHTAETNLTRSAAAHSELQQRLLASETDAHSRIALLEAQRDVAATERAELLGQLEAANRATEAGVRNASVQSDHSDLVRALQEEKSMSSKKDEELVRLRNSLVEEQNRATSVLDTLRAENAALATTAESAHRIQETEERTAELQRQLDEMHAKVASLNGQLLKESAENAQLLHRTHAAESSLAILEATTVELRALELSLKKDIADRDRKLSDQQEQALALAASNNLSTNSDNERSAQFEVFVSQATAIRKSLKAEIERQKTQLSELESEKSALVTQLTRQETTLQFAKKELNATADLKEANRHLDFEKQQLAMQLEATRASLARQAEQEFLLAEKHEREVQARVQSEALCVALREENNRLTLTLEQEGAAAVQNEKKIKSYQEELLQLQRRLAEKAPSPQKVARSPTETTVSAFSPAASPLPFVVESATDMTTSTDYQQQLALKQNELDTAALKLATNASQLAENEKQLHQQRLMVDALNDQVSDLQVQLRTTSAQLSQMRVTHAEHYGSLSASFEKEKELFDLEKLNLSSQVKHLQAQLSSTQENFDQINASALRLEAEVKTYREKWLTVERELTDARLQLSASSAGADLTNSAMRIELREALAAAQHGKVAEETLRAQVADLRKSLDEKEAAVRALRAEVLRSANVLRDEKDKENVQQASAAVAVSAPGDAHAQQVYRGGNDQEQQMQSHSTQHIVALSLEVGRQQATMERLEQHIRNTEMVLQEIKTQGAGRKNAVPPSPVPAKKKVTQQRTDRKDDRHDRVEEEEGEKEEEGGEGIERRGWESSTPDSQQSLLVGRKASREAPVPLAGEFSSSPARKARDGQKAVRSVQFQFSNKTKERRKSSAPLVDLMELVDLKDRIACLVEDMDMDVHDCTTLPTSHSSRICELDERFVYSTARRVLIEGKARLKQETRFLKEVQAICLAAKDSISHNQDCVKNLKAAWRSAKSGPARGDASSTGLTTESVNSVTLKVNSAVDELRETQQVTKVRENRMKGLLQSVQYLEQLVNGNNSSSGDDGNTSSNGQQHLEHLMEIMRLVQEKCVASAADLEALVLSYRSKGTQGGRSASLSKQQQMMMMRGIAHDNQRLRFAETYVEHSSVGGANPAPSEHYYRSAPPPFETYMQVPYSQPPPFANPPLPPAVVAPTKTAAVSAAVSSMRNSELKNRLLQEQIAKITERQSLSKDAYDKHAGWLSSLGREISGVAHGGGSSGFATKAMHGTSASSISISSKIGTGLNSGGGGAGAQLLQQQPRSFGTPLHNQSAHTFAPAHSAADSSAVEALLQNL